MGEPTEPTWGCGTDVSWTGDAIRVRGRLTRAGYQPFILPDEGWELPIGPGRRAGKIKFKVKIGMSCLVAWRRPSLPPRPGAEPQAPGGAGTGLRTLHSA
ncbi:hypothetical protein GCM10010166_30170 [Couchioplanes caeruleus subsp. azureus]|nr:hypothetical protein GCM10010166_30170 [Couchioplanes caeruleus subsp. azureus]